VADDVTVARLLQDVLRRWKVAVAVAVAVFLGAVVYAQGLPNQYTGSAVVSFAPKVEATVGGDTLRVVLPKYVAYVAARATANRVADSIGEDGGRLSDAVTAAIAPDTGNLSIDVTLGTPRGAARAANALARDVLAFARDDPLFEAVITSPALPTSTPTGPPRTLLEAAALVVGVGMGLGAAFVLERGRPRVRTWRDVSLVTGYPVVGRVPLSRSFRGTPVDALDDPLVGAAIRTLRTALEGIAREHPVQVVVVTSSMGGEGKTTVAGALAVALARLDAKVLLVDGDLRRPGMGRLFGVSSGQGLSTVLERGDGHLDGSLQEGPVAGLSLLPTASNANAGDLLARRFGEVLRHAREQFDIIIVDAPPLLGGDDARTLAALCDGVLMVVAADMPAHPVSEAAAALDALGVRVLGAVANRARDPKGFGTYGAYGSYGIQPAAQP